MWNYYRDEPNSGSDGAGNNRINYSIKDSKYFDYKTCITGKLKGDNVEKDDVKIVVPLKCLSIFWITLDMPLINSEVSLTLTWSENYVITSKKYRKAVAAQRNNFAVDEIDNSGNAAFK